MVNVALDRPSHMAQTRARYLADDAGKAYSGFVQAIQQEQERRRTPFGKR